MSRALEHLHRIIDRAERAGALLPVEIKRARACLNLIDCEHHAALARLLLERDDERRRREEAEARVERQRHQLDGWRAAAQQAWAEIATRVAQAVDRRPVLQLISRRGPPWLDTRQGAADAHEGAGDHDDPSPFFWPKFNWYGNAQPVPRRLLVSRSGHPLGVTR